MKKNTTPRQRELLQIIYDYVQNEGYPPTFDEMRERLNVESNQSVIDLLNKLEKNRIIKRNENIARRIAILPIGYEMIGKPQLAAFLGVSSAGAPINSIEITGEWQTLSSDIAKLKDEVFILKVSGDSMINAGIDDGDLVLVKTEKEFVSGNVVLVQINDEVTIKRFISDDNPPYIYLKSENPKYDIIPATDKMTLKGKVISIFKRGIWMGLS